MMQVLHVEFPTHYFNASRSLFDFLFVCLFDFLFYTQTAH